MKKYHKFLRRILRDGISKPDRTGTGTKSIFGYQMRCDLQKGFPIVTTKEVHFKSVVEELLWFLSGSTNVRPLQDRGVRIWNEWADQDGNLGPIYGKQWRNFGGVDQITQLLEGIEKDPYSRRHIVSAWNPPELPHMALAPCHVLMQFYVDPTDRISCHVYQRSADAFLGVPFNIASYSLLLRMVAQQCGLYPGDLVWTGGDCHIYDNHREQVALQLSRSPRESPCLMITDAPDSIFNYTSDSFALINYRPWPAIKAPVAV